MTRTFRSRDGEIILMGTVQGLLSEAERVRAAIERHEPAAIALGTSAETVAYLLRFEGEPDSAHVEELPDHDLVYSHLLARFGPVGLPPPDYLAAVREGHAREISVHGADLSEEAYEETFTKSVSTIGFLRYGRIQNKLAKKPPKADSAVAFTLAWDARLRRIKGIRIVEALREETTAANAARLVETSRGRVLLVVEAAREEGVAKMLVGNGFSESHS